MSQSLSKIYLHSIFNTTKRENLIQKQDQQSLYNYISGIVHNQNGQYIIAGGTENHIHLLTTLPRTITTSFLMQKIKGSSSRWLKQKSSHYKNFSWQKGYAAFSVSASGIQNVRNYIENQEEHHRKLSYQEEVIQFLKNYDVDYDEQYLWD